MADRASARAPQSPAAPLPADYADFLTEIKAHIRTAQTKAALAVNRELLQPYWGISELIVKRQKEGWCKSVVERLAVDIRREFPGISRFSRQDIWFMRASFLAWTDDVLRLQQAVGEFGGKELGHGG